MFFRRTYKFKTVLSAEEIQEKLLGQHVKVHDLDFEVFEKEQKLKVIPHAENIEKIKTLPITHVTVKKLKNGATRVRVYSKPRRIDKGGPYMIMIFCAFCVIGAVLFWLLNKDSGKFPSIVMLGAGIVIFLAFWIRLQYSYFKYIRQIKKFVQQKLTLSS